MKISILLILFITQFLFGDSKSNIKTDIPAIVSVKWLEQNQKNPKLVIVDLRPSEVYAKNHIQNSVNIPAKENLFDKNSFIPKLDILQKTFSEAGIGNESIVVAYDDGKFIMAARFYWILETLGHSNVGLLNVGFDSLEKTKIPISSKNTKVIAKEFVPRVDNTKVQTKLSTLLSIGNKTIIDGREGTHFSGLASKAKRFGHIPTAKNYPCTQNYQVSKDGNMIKDLSELKNLYKYLDKNRQIILYCDGGSESALNYIVLQELGYKVSIYDGSWLEWGNDLKVPISNPSKK